MAKGDTENKEHLIFFRKQNFELLYYPPNRSRFQECKVTKIEVEDFGEWFSKWQKKHN